MIATMSNERHVRALETRVNVLVSQLFGLCHGEHQERAEVQSQVMAARTELALAIRAEKEKI